MELSTLVKIYENTKLQVLPAPDQLSGLVFAIFADTFIRFWLGTFIGMVIIDMEEAKKYKQSERGLSVEYFKIIALCTIMTLSHCTIEYYYPGWELYATLLTPILRSFMHRKYPANVVVLCCFACLWPTSSAMVLQTYGIVALYVYRLAREILLETIYLSLIKIAKWCEDNVKVVKKTEETKENTSNPTSDRVLRSQTKKKE